MHTHGTLVFSPSEIAHNTSSLDIFNPRILDASVRDVAAELSDVQKADLILHGIQNLHPDSSRTTIENAVQSILQIPNLPTSIAASARLARGKVRLSAGKRVGAREDLEAVLRLQPDNEEASALVSRRVYVSEKSPSASSSSSQLANPRSFPLFSTEIWRQIAQCLPRHDLKTLLLVPHQLSRVASQLLFEQIDLHFVVYEEAGQDTAELDPVLDKWHAQRSADILTRIIVDPNFAALVKTLRIFAPMLYRTQSMAFHTGMLANALPKMMNLTNFHCTMSREGLQSIMSVLDSTKPRLRGLSINSRHSKGAPGLHLPNLKTLRCLSVHGLSDNPTPVYTFIAHNHGSIRALSLHGTQPLMSTDALAIRHLTQLDFSGSFDDPATSASQKDVFAEILANGHQLEYLRLTATLLNTNPSAQFRAHRTALPYLKRFCFHIAAVGATVNDPDLFPSLSDFLRDRKNMVSLQLTVPVGDIARARLGFDAAVWGVLPSLQNLRHVHMTLTKDVAPGLATWLIPRGVKTLALEGGISRHDEAGSFVSQLRPGVPPNLLMISFPTFPFQVSNVIDIVERGFPMVRVISTRDDYYTVVRKDDAAPGSSSTTKALQVWPRRQAKYSKVEWLEWLGCEDALWPDIGEFAHPVY